MERRNHHQEMGNNPVGYTPPPQLMVHQEPPSPPVKLPLAPMLSTPPDNHRRPNAVLPTRRGSSIFSPGAHHHHQTLDHHTFSTPPPPPPPPQPHHISPPNDAAASPDPDPTTPTAATTSKSKSPPPPPLAGSTSSIRYRECLKNHAASMGAHVVDGCGEFMPGGEGGTPDSLRCAACDCHRNFHRKEADGDPTPPQNRHPSAAAHQPRHRFASPPGMVSFGGGGAAAESSSGHAAGRQSSLSSGSKKRFRTKFRQDQKDRMQEFGAKLGWRIQKEDEEEVRRFCEEVGVKRQVFKVWMHNNKQAMKKRNEVRERSAD